MVVEIKHGPNRCARQLSDSASSFPHAESEEGRHTRDPPKKTGRKIKDDCVIPPALPTPRVNEFAFTR